MRTIDKAEENIKQTLTLMWQLVARQISDSKNAIINFDKQLANEIIVRERIIDNYELQIDKYCEQFTALQNPVATDLRFVLSHLKMNSNLERIADLAEGLANHVIRHQTLPYGKDQYHIAEMIDTVLRILELAYQAYLSDNSSLAMKLLAMDQEVDEKYSEAMETLVQDIANKPIEKCREMIFLANTIRRIERMGDRCTNLAENIIFHLDAKQMKHMNNIPLYNSEEV